MVFPVVMYGYECWTVKKAEHQSINAFELWYWRKLLRVPWTTRRSNQSILKEINPEYSLEGLMLKLKLQYFGHLMWWPNRNTEYKILNYMPSGNPSLYYFLCKSETVSCLLVSNSLWLHGLYVARPAPLSMEFSGKNTGVGSHSLLQWIFLTQGSNPGSLHCRWIHYPLSHQGSPLFL